MTNQASTAAWRSRWRKVTTRSVVALLRIEVPKGGPFTIYAATSAVRTGDQHWEPLLVGDGSVDAGSSFMSYDVDLGTMTFALADKRGTFCAAGEKLSDVLAQRQFVGAWVTLWLWEQGLVDFSVDALPRFSGRIQTYKTKLGVVEFSALQDRDWNRTITPRTVTRSEFPNAPEDAVGAPLPIVLGRIGGAPMRMPPYGAEYGDPYRIRELVTGGNRMGRAVLVDVGRSDGATQRAKVMVASHKVAQLGNFTPNWGTSPFLEGGDGTMHSLDPLLADVFNDDAQGAGFYIAVGGAPAYFPLFPLEVEASTNPASNQRAVLDRRNEFSHADFDYTALQRTLYLRMGNVSNLGAFGATLVLYVIYRSSPVLTAFQCNVSNTRFGVASTLALPATASPFAPEFRNLNIGSTSAVMPGVGPIGSPPPTWDFGEWRLEFSFGGGGAGWAEVFQVGVAVPYSPRRDVLDTRKVVEQVRVQRRRRHFGLVPIAGGVVPFFYSKSHTTFENQERIENVTQLLGKFYANVYGQPDDGIGTYTGTPGGVIERGPDVLRYILRKYGQVPDGDIESNAARFGSFYDVRALLRTWNQRDMVLGLYVTESLDLSAALPWVAAACVSQPILSEFDNRWFIVPWQVGPDVTYSQPVSRNDLLDPEVGPQVRLTPDSAVLSGLRIAYGWDAQRSAFAHEVALSGSRSQAGHRYRNVRDGYLEVVANVNDKLDFTASGATLTATLTPGLLAPFDRIKDAAAKMGVATGTTYYRGCYGPKIEAGYNDIVYFHDGVAVRTTTVPAVDYATFEALCAAVTTAMNSVSAVPNWTVSYNRSTLKATASRPSGGGSIGVSIGTVWMVLGFNTSGGAALPASSAVEVEEQRMLLWSYVYPLSLLWLSGPNGLNGTKRSCWEVLGFDWVEDNKDRGVRYVWSGVCPKLDRESQLAATDALFSAKREVTIDGRAIYDTSTALEVRNRIAALLGKPRAIVTLSSEVLADMRRGDVFEFDVDMDLLTPYPAPNSDGSWAGKRFRVLETSQKFGTSWHTEVVAIDVTD